MFFNDNLSGLLVSDFGFESFRSLFVLKKGHRVNHESLHLYHSHDLVAYQFKLMLSFIQTRAFVVNVCLSFPQLRTNSN
jgi:hypothetical protein